MTAEIPSNPSNPPDPTDTFENNLSSVLTSLIANAEAESIRDAYAALATHEQAQAGLQKILALDLEGYYHAVTYPASKVTRGLVGLAYPGNHEVQFIFENYAFLRAHTRELIESCEGSSCCADKARTVCKTLARYFAENKEIVFNYEAEYTFHLPRVVLTTQEDILEWYQAIKRLTVGKGDQYMAALAKYEKLRNP